MNKKILLFSLPLVVPTIVLVSSCKTEYVDNDDNVNKPGDDSTQKPDNPDTIIPEKPEETKPENPEIPEQKPEVPEIPEETTPEQPQLQIVDIIYEGNSEKNAEEAFKKYFYGLDEGSPIPGGSDFSNKIKNYLKVNAPEYFGFKGFTLEFEADKNDSNILYLGKMIFYNDDNKDYIYVVDSQTIEKELHYKFIFTRKTI